MSSANTSASDSETSVDRVRGLKDLIDSTVAVFLLSMVAYIGAYCFELGYLRWFGVNYQSAHVQTESFVISFIVLTPVVLIGFGWLASFKEVRREILDSKLAKTEVVGFILGGMLSRAFMALAVYWSLLAYTFSFSWLGYALGLIALFLIAVGGARRTEPVFSASVDQYVVWGGVFSVFLVLISICLGMFYADSKNIFKTTVVDGHRYVVVREYGSQFILKEITSDNHLTPNIKIVPVDDLGGYSFRLEEIKGVHR